MFFHQPGSQMNRFLESGTINMSLSGYLESVVRVGTRRQKMVGIAECVFIARQSFWLPGVNSPAKRLLIYRPDSVEMKNTCIFFILNFGEVAQWLERATDVRVVTGSNPLVPLGETLAILFSPFSVSVGRGNKSRWSILSGVYARGG